MRRSRRVTTIGSARLGLALVAGACGGDDGGGGGAATDATVDEGVKKGSLTR